MPLEINYDAYFVFPFSFNIKFPAFLSSDWFLFIYNTMASKKCTVRTNKT